DKPVGILNTTGYYDPLLQFLQGSIRAGFMNDWQMDLVRFGTSPAEMCEALVAGSRPAAAQDLSRI
ncbi:MAG: LOG family protein, partial [Ramlibacter sp.]